MINISNKYINDANKYLELINQDYKIKELWNNYRDNYEYAKEITFDDTILAIKQIIDIIELDIRK